MSQDRIKLIVQRILKDAASQWMEFQEPMPLSQVSTRITGSLQRAVGKTWDATRFCEHLETLKLIHIVRTKTGKRWLFLWDVWNQMTPELQADWKNRCWHMIDPYLEHQAITRKRQSD